MLSRIRDFFDSAIGASMDTDRETSKQHALHLATASLLIEVMKADFETVDDEKQLIHDLMRQFSDLQDEELASLIELAETEVEEASSLFQFTALVDSQFDYEDKVTVVEMLWQVAYADGRKDKYEEYMVRKVADLLHVSHRDFIQARHRVEEQ